MFITHSRYLMLRLLLLFWLIHPHFKKINRHHIFLYFEMLNSQPTPSVVPFCSTDGICNEFHLSHSITTPLNPLNLTLNPLHSTWRPALMSLPDLVH